ncbi:MAG: DUF4012 domain-containing protein [Candidatus Dojkabacteria bacterium]|nr:DUF4012 domain-containing protein [Candidatus Dojkabacteria bacterium]
MSSLSINKIKSQTPVSIIVHGGNRAGYLLSKTLVEQGCHVIIIDKFSPETKKYILELKQFKSVDFFEFKGLESVYKNLKRFDYLFYLLNEGLIQNDFDSKEFLKETGHIDLSLKNAKKNNAKFTLVTSLALNRELANRVNNLKLSSPSPYSDIELQKYCETLTAEFKDKTNLNARIIRVGTLIGKGIEKISDNIIHELTRDATQKPQITIKGEGLDIHNLINENDATYGILKLTFSDKTKGEVITLANRNNYTTLSIAYKLLELNTEAQSIKFIESDNKDFVVQDLYVPAPHATKYGWSQQITLENSLIEQIQKYYEQVNKKWDIKEERPTKKTQRSNVKVYKTSLGAFLSKIMSPIKNLFRKREIDYSKIYKGIGIGIVAAIFTYFILYPIIGTLLGLAIISTNTKTLGNSITELDTGKTSIQITKLERNINRVSNTINTSKWVFRLLGKDDLYNEAVELLMGANYATEGAGQLVDSIEPLANYIKDFQPALDFQSSSSSTTREYREYLIAMQGNEYKVDDATYKISLANEIISNLNTSVFPKSLQDKILEIKDLTSTLQTASKDFKDVITFLPDLLGVDERKRYLILLQNESEIRSTGGWLTSYGILGIESGQVRELFVDDIYNADGTLKIQGKKITPPLSLKNALGLSSWSFSLVNWYPDLTQTYISAEPFVKALGKGDDLDGIITIDISFIQKLLDKWEGIEVPGESEIITSENIYNKIFKLHEEFVPGSTQKTTFLANLANEIIQKLLSKNINDLISLGSVFSESLDQKHLQASFKDRDAFNFFNSKSWACSLDSKYNDAPISIDWNWGGNKANMYLEKNYNLSIDITDENTMTFKYSISVENTSDSTTYPEGNYINYQRIYMPSSAAILSVKGLTNNDYDVYKESGFKVLGGWYNTNIGNTNTFEISYKLIRSSDNLKFPITVDGENIFLTLDIFKQPGESFHAYKLDITYPNTWNLESAENLNTLQNQLSSRFELSQDESFDIIWRKAD